MICTVTNQCPFCLTVYSNSKPCIYGKIKSDNRARPKHETADRLVYCHEALHLRTKMQKANYQPPVVKWDDSDSTQMCRKMRTMPSEYPRC